MPAVATFALAFSDRMHGRSLLLNAFLEHRIGKLIGWWFGIAFLASALRIAVSPLSIGSADVTTFVPYVLLIGAPTASLLLALRWFADGGSMPQPTFRFARVGRWQSLSSSAARAHPLYGTSGIMVSLLIGMLMNVPVRAAEYLVTMPAIPHHVPAWLSTLHLAMTLDTVVVSSLYVVAFVMALRKVALFPRFLVLVWALDILSQLLIGNAAAAAGLPVNVATSLGTLLEGNLKKVMISICLWLPYLLLSTRVNVTYRQRHPA